MNTESYIETYPVGLLADIRHHKIKQGFKYVRHQAANRDWRAVRNYFNGYLAEWHYPPQGMRHYRCGRGWTRKAALRSFGKHIAAANSVREEKE